MPTFTQRAKDCIRDWALSDSDYDTMLLGVSEALREVYKDAMKQAAKVINKCAERCTTARATADLATKELRRRVLDYS